MKKRNSKYLAISLVFLSVFSCKQEKSTHNISPQKEKLFKQELSDGSNLTMGQKIIMRDIIAKISSKIRTLDYSKNDYQPLPDCNKGQIAGDCENIFDDLQIYLSANASTLSYSLVDTKDYYAAVDLTKSLTHIYLASDFFTLDISERLRSIAHELHHLAGNIQPHSTQKDCAYFDNYALKAEHCFTGEANLVKKNVINTCSSSAKGLFILSK
jgi:hypothetical protein